MIHRGTLFHAILSPICTALAIAFIVPVGVSLFFLLLLAAIINLILTGSLNELTSITKKEGAVVGKAYFNIRFLFGVLQP